MTDRVVVRIVVGGLLSVVLFSLGLIGFLAVKQIPIPDMLQGVATTALGALAGILARTAIAEPVVTAQPAVVDVKADP